ncbi:MAG: 2-hydroxy-acid oxidase [Alphaproteobacteria bacterium HGW-Alphaproteobacteria-2]|nr:MAG: 2-hydroxy-acid oxidase [Alphaproteobacteria bacterium HGW-Alphaproteobacteria-2]
MGIAEAVAELRPVLGERLSTSLSDLALHGQNESWYPPMPPDAVAYPESTEEVAAIVRICAAQGCPLIGWGAGTSLEGHALARYGGISVDFSRMNRMLAINPEDMDCTVQPGITREDLNTELRATGLFFPVDPGANATLGGMASTRASGTTAVRYGTMRDNVIGLEVVLADGRVIHTGTRARKSAAGYDLTALFVGAEGTLGLITALTLRLYGQPEAIAAGICAFEDVASAVDTVIQTIQMGVPMARIELVDADTVRAFNGHAGAEMPEKPHLLVEFHGTEAGVAEQAEMFGALAAENGASGYRSATKPEERSRLWKMRHNAYYAILSLRPGTKGLTTDLCVPISRLAEAIEETRADIAASPLMGPIVGHVGDGNFHCALLVEPGNEAELKIAKELSHRMAERALRLGGTVTGEHGIGMGKTAYMEAEHGAGWDVMGAVKRALDPGNLMNPGKLLRGN